MKRITIEETKQFTKQKEIKTFAGVVVNDTDGEYIDVITIPISKTQFKVALDRLEHLNYFLDSVEIVIYFDPIKKYLCITS